nr:glutamate receptor 1-like [Vanessa tameamea]
MFKRIILFSFSLCYLVLAKDQITVNFIKSFIGNENKPTMLVCNNLCWRKSEKIAFFKELSDAGIRSSSVFIERSSLQDHALLYFVDLTCPLADVALNISGHLRFPYRWLVLHHKMNHNNYDVKNLWNLPLLADSEFVLAIRNGDNITLSELHKPSSNGPTYSNPRGYYNDILVDTRTNREMFRRRKDIMGHPLTMANVIQDSNSSIYHLPRENRLELYHDPIAKSSWMNVHIAFQMLNATPRYIFSHRWGYKRNGQWSGMINDLNTGRADLGTNCVASSDRLSVVVFTDSISKFKVKFIFRQPPLFYVSNIFTLPFSFNVWMATILTFIISSVTVLLASKLETLTLGKTQSQLDGSIGDAMLLTMSALSQQGCSKEPKKLSGRIMLFVIFTALMALYAAYSANIVVLLQAPSNSIKTLEQLAHSKMTIAALDVDYNHFVLKAQKDQLRRLIYKRIKPEKGEGHFYSLNEGVERLRQGLFAFHSVMESVYRRVEETFLETEKCDLMEVDFMNALDPFVPIYKHSPYIELLRVAFKRIHESGIQMALQKRIDVPKPRCTEKMSAFSSVGLPNLRPVLLFMMYGIIASIVILVIEILVHKI